MPKYFAGAAPIANENVIDMKVKMIKRPANLEVKAHKTVVRQDVRPLSNGDEVIGTNAGKNVQYPEERTPIVPGLSFDELLGQIMNGRAIRGLCCRDSSCLFCHPDNLLDCRKNGFSYWKFTDGDDACYKIKLFLNRNKLQQVRGPRGIGAFLIVSPRKKIEVHLINISGFCFFNQRASFFPRSS